MTTHRYPGKRFDSAGRHVGPGPWLDLIHAVNGLEPESFGNPDSTGDWWAGGYVEEYPAFRVVHHLDSTVTVTGKTPEADALLDRAAAQVMS